MLAHALLIEGVGHAGQFDLAVQRAIRRTKQRPVWDTVAIAIGGNRCAFHVNGNSARRIEVEGIVFEIELPVTVIGCDNGTGSQERFELAVIDAGNIAHGICQGELHFGERRQRDMRRQVTIQDVVHA